MVVSSNIIGWHENLKVKPPNHPAQSEGALSDRGSATELSL